MLFFTVDFNPVMPPTEPGYSPLADDPPPSLSPQPSQKAFSSLPPRPSATAGTKAVRFAAGPGNGVVGSGVTGVMIAGADGGRASYGGIAPVIGGDGGVSGGGSGGDDRRSVSLRSILPLQAAGAGPKAAGSPSASSTSSSSSYEYYRGGGGATTAGGRGPAPGGALGSGGSGGDTAATGGVPMAVPMAVAPSAREGTRFLVGDESNLEHGSGCDGGDGRRTKRDGDGGGNPFENPFAADDSTGAEETAGEGGRGEAADRERQRQAALPSPSPSLSAAPSPRGADKQPPGFGTAGRDQQGQDEERTGANQKRKKRRRWRDHQPSPNDDDDHHHRAGGTAREELRTYRAVAATAAGVDTGAGVDLVAPYSSALQAAGATPNSNGWGWYDVDPAVGQGPPGVGRIGTQGGGGGAGGGGSGDGDGGGELQKNDLGQALRMIVSNRVVLVLFAASSARMIATWAIASFMAVRGV